MAKKTDSTAIKDSKHDAMFKLVKNQKGNIVIIAGNQQVSQKKFKTFTEADNYIGTKPWEIIVNVSFLVVNEYEKQKQIAEENKETAKTA